MVSRRRSFLQNDFDIDDVIRRLISVKPQQKNLVVSEHELKVICGLAHSLFLSQPMLLELEAPLKIAGESVVMEFSSFGVAQVGIKLYAGKKVLKFCKVEATFSF